MANKRQLTPRLNLNEPNIIIDGGMEIWPEGTSRSIANNAQAYGGCLFQCGNSATGVTLTNSQQASIPSGTNVPFSNQLSKTAAGSMAAGTYSVISYQVEGYDVNKLLNDEFSIIFWVKSSVASNRTLSLRNGSSSHSYLQQYTISAANTWQLVALKVPALSTCPGTINKTNTPGLIISWSAVMAGTTYQTSTLGSWVSGAFLSGVGEDTTWLTGTTHDFSIAGVMVLPGDWRSLSTNTSQFRFLRSGRNFQEEVQKSYRYYQTNSHSAPQAGNSSGVLGGIGRVGLPVDMRTIPTFLAYTGNGGTVNAARNDNNGATEGALIYGVSSNNISIRSTSALSAGVSFSVFWTADARF